MVDSETLATLGRSGRPLSEQRAAMRQGLFERGLSVAAVDTVMAYTVDGFVLEECETLQGSRLGGAGFVRLPQGEGWPTDLSELTFLFEICLDDLVGREGVDDVPQSGALLVFHDETPGLDLSLRSVTRVLFRGPNDPGIETTEGARYPEQLIGQIPLLGYATPVIDHSDAYFAALESLADDWDHVFLSVADLMSHTYGTHRLFGAAHPSQFSLPTSIAVWFQRPESQIDHAAFSPAERRGEGWRLLLQPGVVSRPDLGLDLQWDVGPQRYYVIPEIDLKAGRYDRVITIFQ